MPERPLTREEQELEDAEDYELEVACDMMDSLDETELDIGWHNYYAIIRKREERRKKRQEESC